MPRKPGNGPTILVIEGLSDGREVREKTFVDDFSGKAMPMVQDMRPVRDVKLAHVAKREIAKAKRQEQKEMLENLGMLPKPAQPAPSHPVLARNQFLIGDPRGPQVILTLPKRPWRRI